jgi:branched-chain amino acid transport system ATP-binding protein
MTKPTEHAPLLEIFSIRAAYGSVTALHDVSLHVNRGEIVSLIGANGAGKSTLLGCIFGNPRARAGQIVYDGNDITHISTHYLASKGVAYVPEGRRIFPDMTVLENLQLGALHQPLQTVNTRLQKQWELFPRLHERRNQRAGTLSGGEQQMLAISRAMMGNPQLLLLDEPSLGLAPILVQTIFATIKALAAEGVTIFLVEQNAYHALRLADRAYVLANGSICLAGSGQDLLNDPQVKDAYLGG